MSRLTPTELRTRKSAGKIVMMTAYTAPVARRADAHIDVLLVGDSLGMVVYGMDSTTHVTLEMMAAHGSAVVRSSRRAMVVVDMPFGSYQTSSEQALTSCRWMMDATGAGAVKMEGGVALAETISRVVNSGIPVMGHVGLMPQYVDPATGFKAQGRSAQERETVLRDAKAVEAAGAFAVVLEAIDESLAREVTAALSIPTIGIGASPVCDGQVLVIDDLLGITEKTPRFVKRYAELGSAIEAAITSYARDVRSGSFPAPEHCYQISKQPII